MNITILKDLKDATYVDVTCGSENIEELKINASFYVEDEVTKEKQYFVEKNLNPEFHHNIINHKNGHFYDGWGSILK